VLQVVARSRDSSIEVFLLRGHREDHESIAEPRIDRQISARCALRLRTARHRLAHAPFSQDVLAAFHDVEAKEGRRLTAVGRKRDGYKGSYYELAA